MESRRWTVLFFLVSLLWAGWGPDGMCLGADEAGAADAERTAAEPEGSQAQDEYPWDPNDTKTSDSTWDHLGGEGKNPYVQFLIAILLVGAMGFGAYYFSRKVAPKIGLMQGKNITVVETVHLGTNKKLHVVDIAGIRKILIGSSNESIQYLTDVPVDLPDGGGEKLSAEFKKEAGTV